VYGLFSEKVFSCMDFFCSSRPITFLRACSYDPAYRDVSLTETNISVRSYGIFRPACRDEITL
jgi:hypothetical protein